MSLPRAWRYIDLNRFSAWPLSSPPPHRLAPVWAMSIVDYLIHHQHIVASVLRCRSERRNPKKTRIWGVLRKIRKSHFQKKESSKLFNFYISRIFFGSCVAKSCISQQPSRTSSIESSNHRSQCVDLIWFDWFCRCQLTSETKSCVDWRLVVENRGVGLAFRKSNEKFHNICSKQVKRYSKQVSNSFQATFKKKRHSWTWDRCF